MGALLLVALVALVFRRALEGDFLIWDDNTSIYENPYLGGLSWARMTWAFTNVGQSLRYMPFAWLGYSVVFEIGGLDPWHYHAANLGVHVLNTVLLYLALRRLVRMARPEGDARWRELGAWFGAAVWAVHPLRVELIAWALPLTYGLSTCALLVTLHCFLAAMESGRRAWKIATWVAYAVALLTYPIVISAWLGLAILAFWMTRCWANPSRTYAWRWVLTLGLPALASAGLALWIRWYALGFWHAPAPMAEFGLLHRLAQTGYTWAYYLWSPGWPFRLAPIYDGLLAINPGDPKFLAAGGMVLAGSVATLRYRRRWPGAAAWWWSAFTVALPTLGLTEHPFFTSDRYTVLVGLVLSVAIAIAWSRASGAAARAVAGVCACAGLVFLVALTLRQVPRWRNTETLFTYALGVSREPMVRAECHFRLCLAAENAGRLDDARQECADGLAQVSSHMNLRRAAMRLNGASAGVRPMAATQIELGRFRLEMDDLGAAEAHYRRALAIDPAAVEARFRLMMLLTETHRPREALGHYLWLRAKGASKGDALVLERIERGARSVGDEALVRAVFRATRKTEGAARGEGTNLP